MKLIQALFLFTVFALASCIRAKAADENDNAPVQVNFGKKSPYIYNDKVMVDEINIIQDIDSLEKSFYNSRTPHIVHKNKCNKALLHSLYQSTMFYSGYYITNITNVEIEEHMLKILDLLEISYLLPLDRMLLIENIIKSGSIKAVEKIIIEMFKHNFSSELVNHCSLTTKNETNQIGRKYERPLFWLPAIVTRWNTNRVPEVNYREIEIYLCNFLCPSGIALVDGVEKTRQNYIDDVDNWKKKQNEKLSRKRFQLSTLDLN